LKKAGQEGEERHQDEQGGRPPVRVHGKIE
jgi:hypothetical protein